MDGNQVEEAKAKVVPDPFLLPEPPKWKTWLEVLLLLPRALPFWGGVVLGSWLHERWGGDDAEHDEATVWHVTGHVVVWSLVIAAIGSIIYAWISW